MKEDLQELIQEHGFVTVIEALQACFTDVLAAHRRRKDFVNVTNSVLGSIVTSLKVLEEKYGYVPGQE